ncbi:hypothetical protein [Epilithonimonas sp.]|uniref:hypothetical protein n=1 Tax=Epilithonimonas sp. TaxID=2894511 RepID=UPI0035B48805
MKTPIIYEELSKIDREELIVKIFTRDENQKSAIVEINKNGSVVYFLDIKVKYDIFPEDIGVFEKKIKLLQVRDNAGKILKPNDKEVLKVEQFFQSKIVCEIIYFPPAHKD